MYNIYIQIEDLVANAFIDLLEANSSREILYSDLDKYGAKVIEQINSNGEAKAILVVSRESQLAVVEDYSDMFEAFEREGSKGIRLIEGIHSIDLWDRFCTSLSYIVLRAFQAPAVKEALGIS
ncbi:MAG: hypothetical protein J1E61_00570 [Lachnospiraceae bacterium]|nr:hypothetical protein [Lachnospiraceae bacterium]